MNNMVPVRMLAVTWRPPHFCIFRMFLTFFFLMFWKRDALITYDRETLTQHSIHYLGPHQQTGMEACLGYVIGKEPDS